MRDLAIVLLALCLSACHGTPPRQEPRSPPDGLLAAWKDAFLARDAAAMRRCYRQSGDTVLVHSTGDVVVGAEAIGKDYDAAFANFEFEQVVFEPGVARQWQDTAWITGRLRMATVQRSDGSRWQLEIDTTFVLAFDDGRWQIAGEKSVALPGVPRARPRS